MVYNIAVAGAGPAGLTFARVLTKQARENGIPSDAVTITLFEVDPHLNARTEQVGTLDLHKDTGLAAIKACGLWEEFQKWARYDAEELIICDKNGTEVVHMMPESTVAGIEETRPEIDRQRLMKVLLGSVISDADAGGINVEIQWGKKLVSVTQGHVLKFADGSISQPYDLVIGADGAWSKVRSQLTDIRPTYAGICGFETVIRNPALGWPQIDRLLGPGSYFVYTDSKGLMSHRLANGDFKMNYWQTNEETFAAGIFEKCNGQEDKLASVVGQWFTTWRSEFQDCVKASSEWRPRALYELPVGISWQHREGFTLIGDAAHLMTPFAGKGLNAAMKDALVLAEQIVGALKHSTSLDSAVRNYETEMFARATKVQNESMFNKTHMFRADAPIGFMVDMMDVIFEAKGRSLNSGLLRWIPVKKSVWTILWLKTTWGGIYRRILSLLRA